MRGRIFSIRCPDHQRGPRHCNHPNGLDEIKRRLRQSANGKVDVEITVDVPGTEFDIDRHTGEASQLVQTAEQQRAAVQSALALLTVLGVPMYPPARRHCERRHHRDGHFGGSAMAPWCCGPTNRAWQNWHGNMRAIIAMRPVGYLPVRPAYISAQPYGNPQGAGQTRVSLSLKRA